MTREVLEGAVPLAAAVVIDAFVVRTVLVPALMHLFGAANRWLPAWLHRTVPTVHIEADDLDRHNQYLRTPLPDTTAKQRPEPSEATACS